MSDLSGMGCRPRRLRSVAIKATATIVVVGCLGFGLSRAVQQARAAAEVSTVMCNLKTIGLALHNYQSEFGSFPPAYLADREGRPMHSWRVLILPYLEQQGVYAAYNFAQPWDSPSNRKLEAAGANIFLRTDLPSGHTGSTSFVAVAGPTAAWKSGQCMTSDQIAQTLMVVEVPDGHFRWMEPRDLALDDMSFQINDGSGRGLGSRLGGARVLAADGGVYNLPNGFAPAKLKAALTVGSGAKLNELLRSNTER